ncbi:tripartite tricarboxylate transporter TctB family protein [Pararhodobacter sp. SW119]|uniref:tripartite tricarboxylate transporter TctB family protein n=1 Tax=Pararhodobacter sp. SW119 TaxID=2780075 RepID=UPI001ADFD54C|nr:tripartite tricarboxylate transporter TctB family protein [Pararhodobacter sp. SW119]
MSDEDAGTPPLRRRLAAPGVIGGALSLLVGLWVMGEAGSYALGTARRMGPGYFPMLLGALMAILGTVLAATAFWRGEPPGEAEDRADPRALIAVLAGLGAFAYLLPRAGLIPAVAALVMIAAQGSGQLRPLAALALAGALAVLSWAIFGLGLGLQLPAFAARP